jgi:hypothetical protein
MTPTCHLCRGTFTLGETVNASDWTVIDENGCHGEVRYEHLTCSPQLADSTRSLADAKSGEAARVLNAVADMQAVSRG